MLIHSKEKLLNFLLLTQQWPDKQNRLLNPSIEKKMWQEVMVQEQTCTFSYLFQCMTCIGRQQSPRSHHDKHFSSLQQAVALKNSRWSKVLMLVQKTWVLPPLLLSSFSSSLFLGSVQQSSMCLTSLDFNNLGTKPVS